MLPVIVWDGCFLSWPSWLSKYGPQSSWGIRRWTRRSFPFHRRWRRLRFYPDVEAPPPFRRDWWCFALCLRLFLSAWSCPHCKCTRILRSPDDYPHFIAFLFIVLFYPSIVLLLLFSLDFRLLGVVGTPPIRNWNHNSYSCGWFFVESRSCCSGVFLLYFIWEILLFSN